jgi:UDP-N-acetylglucosamine 1-carboxyvinyltransferase
LPRIKKKKMAKFVIEGGHRLQGEITPQGAKNEALEVICATVLSKEEITISNVPNILDVNNLIQLLIDMGIYVRKEGNNIYTFKADSINEKYLESDEFLSRCASLRGVHHARWAAAQPNGLCPDTQNQEEIR